MLHAVVLLCLCSCLVVPTRYVTCSCPVVSSAILHVDVLFCFVVVVLCLFVMLHAVVMLCLCSCPVVFIRYVTFSCSVKSFRYVTSSCPVLSMKLSCCVYVVVL